MRVYIHRMYGAAFSANIATTTKVANLLVLLQKMAIELEETIARVLKSSIYAS